MKLSPLAHQANAHDDAVWSVAWSGAGEGLLLTGSVDESVKAWRAAGDGLEMAHAYTGHTLGVVALAAAPNGLVASSALDSLIRVWSVDTHETRCVIETPPAENWQIAFAPGDEPAHLAVAGGVSGGVKLYSIEQDGGEQVSGMSLPEVAADKAKNSRFVQVRKQDPDRSTHHPSKRPLFPSHLFSIESVSPPSLTTLSSPPPSTQSVAYSPDGRRIACGAMDGTVALFDAGTGKLLHTLQGHAMPVRSLCFDVSGKTLYTGCDDGHIHAYDAEHRSLQDALPGHKSWVLGVSISPDGNALCSCSSDATVKLWDVGTRSCVQTMSDQSEAVWGVCFGPGGDKVASVCDDKSVNLYDFV